MINKLFANCCIHCGIAVKHNCYVFCESCNREMLWCVPREKDGILSVLSYQNPQARTLILYMKDHRDKDAFALGASLIAHRLLRSGLTNLDEYCITYAPRSPISRLTCGFDQSREIALCLADELFGDKSRCVDLIGRRFFSKTQKLLGARARRKSTSGSLFLRSGVKIPEKIIVVDDVVTTGATLERISRLLADAGAQKCVLISVACREPLE